MCHNDCDPITDVCVKCRGETGIGREKEAYASRVWLNYRDAIADFLSNAGGKPVLAGKGKPTRHEYSPMIVTLSLAFVCKTKTEKESRLNKMDIVKAYC